MTDDERTELEVAADFLEDEGFESQAAMFRKMLQTHGTLIDLRGHRKARYDVRWFDTEYEGMKPSVVVNDHADGTANITLRFYCVRQRSTRQRDAQAKYEG